MREDFYTETYEIDTRHWWCCARREVIESLVRKFTADSSPLQVADIGCGTGANLAMMRAFGDPVGVDMSLRALDFTRSRGESRLIAGQLPHLPLRNDAFDLVFALDTIEHTEDDFASMQELTRICKPGGFLVITVPAYQWLWSEHDQVNFHKRRYHRAQLRALVQRPDLRVRKLSYMNTFLAPLIIFYRLFLKIARKFSHRVQPASDAAIPPAIVNRWFHGIFRAERVWLERGSFPFGISLVCILQKR